ncbi:MAG: cytochrome c oxidase assembly protein [Actinomycetota bacterium]
MPANWPLDPLVISGLLVAGIAYVRAERRVRGERSGRPLRRRLFLAGLAVVFAALQSPIDAGAATSFGVHMFQHLLLTMVAAPLLVLGAPVTLVLRATTPQRRRRLLFALRSAPVRLLSAPIVAWSLFVAMLWGTHFTALYELTLRSSGIHALEHVLYLGTAVLFWIPVVGLDPAPAGLSHPARILYLFLAMPAMAFLGLALFSADHVLYPTYAAIEGASRALADQRVAGALMWTGTMFLIVPALGFVLLDWMRADDRAAQRIDARLQRAHGPAAVAERPMS